jgi:hypothetical protein
MVMIKENYQNEIDAFEVFFNVLITMQETVGKNIQYFSTRAMEVIKDILKAILTSETYNYYQCQKPDNENIIKSYIIATKNAAKALIWEIERFQHNQQLKNQTSKEPQFETIDELWEYWDQMYDQEEMSQSLEILEKAIDSTRRKQGGRTLFS